LQKPAAERRDGAFAVVTISKDDPEGLVRTLASIARQTLRPRELALVRAGGSRDAAYDPAVAGRVLEVADSGHGIAAAFNAGIEACSAEWLVFLNGGDAFSQPGSLARLAAACLAAPDADIVSCRAMTDAGTTIPRGTPHDLCDFLFISHQASAFRRSLFSQIGPYATAFRIRMDLDWMARYLLRNGHGRIAFTDEVVVDYRLDGLSSTSIVDFYTEELRVLCRSPRFLPALTGFWLRRVPGRALIEARRRLGPR